MSLLRRSKKNEEAGGGAGGSGGSGGAGERRSKRRASGRVTPKATGRYTPPVPKEYKTSPLWVPVLMLTFFVLGMVIIISNYLPGAGFLPGDSDNRYLLVGLGLITAGFITATKYR